MISEHNFASGYGSLWHSLTPLSDGYWKMENMLVKRAYAPLPSVYNIKLRGIVNEAAFRAFCSMHGSDSSNTPSSALEHVGANLAGAVEYVARLTSRFKPNLDDFNESCSEEAAHLAMRLAQFFPQPGTTILRPQFKGCGLISACEGDLIRGDCLYEIKAGDRAFRVTDLRQLLVYAALAHASGNISFHKIGLFNPRTGSLWVRTLDQVCTAIAGVKAADTLSALAGAFADASVSR